MDSLTVRKKRREESRDRIIFLVTIGISAILLVAAYGKWFYPAEWLKPLDRVIGIFEFLFVGFLLYARRLYKAWALAAFIFASWGGYAYFWYQLSLPCHCMGELLRIPTGLSLGLDGLFWGIALSFIYGLGGGRRGVYWKIS